MTAIRKSLALACLALGSIGAHADVVFSGFAHGSETVNIAVTSAAGSVAEAVYAGSFLASIDGGLPFAAYCIDVYQSLGFGTGYIDYSVANHGGNQS